MDRPGRRNARVASFMVFMCLVLAPMAAFAAPGGQGNGNGNYPVDPTPAVPELTTASEGGAGADNGKSDAAPGTVKKDDPAPALTGSTASISAPSDPAPGSDATGKSDGSKGAAKKSDSSTTSSLSSTSAPTTSASATGGSTTSTGNGNGNGNGNGKANGGNKGGTGGSTNGGGNGFDPDPPPQQTPPATTGPTQCPSYSQGSGPSYDHDNCDGSQGGNGNGGNGKCAGCTGKADDKSPGGQYSGDHNNGYECDHNKGVGKGNPAHSKCKTTPPCTVNCNQCTVDCNPCTKDCDPCTVNCNPCKKDCDPCTVNCNPGCQADCDPGCQTNCNPGCRSNCDPDCLDLRSAAECEDDDVLGLVLKRPSYALRGSDAVAPLTVAGAALPFTGGDPAAFVLTGLALIIVGACAMAVVGRKRRRDAYLEREGLSTL